MLLHTRREFVNLLALSGAGLFPVVNRLSGAEAATSTKPNSKVAGVQLGINVPYSFAKADMSGADILKNCLQLGISAVELRTQPVEAFLGMSAELLNPKKSDAATASANTERLREWRKAVSMDRVKEFRKMYEQAGVLIEIVKVDGIFKMTDDELDYVFTL